MADEQAALLAQIKALSGAIDQRRSSSRGSSFRGGGGRGGGGRGQPSQGAAPSRHRTLVLSSTAGQETTANGSDPASSTTPVSSTPTEGDGGGQEGWVKRKSTHNMSLVSSSAFKKTEPARLAAMAASQSAKKATADAKKASKVGARGKGGGSNAVRRGDRMGEVIVDGVVFVFDDSGTKLVKKDPQPTAEEAMTGGGGKGGMEGSGEAISTPLRTSIDGRKFIRTKTGNLISQDLLDRRREAKRSSEKLKRLGEMGRDIGSHQKMRDANTTAIAKKRAGKVVRKRGLCSFYNKTGQCKRGLSCPYTHNPDRLAICPGSLRPSGCMLPKGSCPLSHDRRPERVPHCVHFLRLGSCRNGEECLYTHPAEGVELTNESPICMDFSDLGWCERGQNCNERHTWDCPDFLRRGSCSRKGCKLMHVIRSDKSKEREEQHDLADADLFVLDGEEGEEGEEERKRKRDGSGSGGEEEEWDNDEERGPTWKATKTRDFDRQQDFITFSDDGEEGEEDDGDEEQQSGPDDGSDHESVHSDSSQD